MAIPFAAFAIVGAAIALRNLRDRQGSPESDTTNPADPSRTAPTTDPVATGGIGSADPAELRRLQRQNERLKRQLGKRKAHTSTRSGTHAQDGNAGLDRGNRVPGGSPGQAGNDPVVLTDPDTSGAAQGGADNPQGESQS